MLHGRRRVVRRRSDTEQAGEVVQLTFREVIGRNGGLSGGIVFGLRSGNCLIGFALANGDGSQFRRGDAVQFSLGNRCDAFSRGGFVLLVEIRLKLFAEFGELLGVMVMTFLCVGSLVYRRTESHSRIRRK